MKGGGWETEVLLQKIANVKKKGKKGFCHRGRAAKKGKKGESETYLYRFKRKGKKHYSIGRQRAYGNGGGGEASLKMEG